MSDFSLSGEQQRRNMAIVQEVLDDLGIKLNKPEPTQSDEQKAIRQMMLANQEVAQAVKDYYEKHPIATDIPEFRKMIMGIYLLNFCKWSKDDVLFMLSVLQTQNAMKRFGYE